MNTDLVNPADIFIAYKTKTPSEVKTSIKDFLATNERGAEFHINMLSSIQAGFEAANKTTGEIYSNDDYIKTLIHCLEITVITSACVRKSGTT